MRNRRKQWAVLRLPGVTCPECMSLWKAISLSGSVFMLVKLGAASCHLAFLPDPVLHRPHHPHQGQCVCSCLSLTQPCTLVHRPLGRSQPWPTRGTLGGTQGSGVGQCPRHLLPLLQTPRLGALAGSLFPSGACLQELRRLCSRQVGSDQSCPHQARPASRAPPQPVKYSSPEIKVRAGWAPSGRQEKIGRGPPQLLVAASYSWFMTQRPIPHPPLSPSHMACESKFPLRRAPVIAGKANPIQALL